MKIRLGGRVQGGLVIHPVPPPSEEEVSNPEEGRPPCNQACVKEMNTEDGRHAGYEGKGKVKY